MRQRAPQTYLERLAQLEALRLESLHANGRGRREAAREGQVHGARADRQAPRPGELPRDRRVRPPPDARLRDAADPAAGRRRDHRPRADRRPAGLRLQPGLHPLRRIARRGDGREDRQGDGPRREDRVSGDRDQRLRRRPPPGGSRLAGRLRGDLPAERPLLGRDPPDLADHGPVRRRRGLLAGDHRLRLHGQGDVPHVHHRPRRRPDGDRRGGRLRGARRGDDPQHEVRGRPVRLRGRGRLPRGRPLPPVVPAPEQPRARSPGLADRRPRAGRRPSSTRSSPTTRTSRTTCDGWSS